MTAFVAEEEQFKFEISSDLRVELDAVFEAQGVFLKEGMNRLVRFLVSAPEEMRAVILAQVPDASAVAIAKEIVRRGGSWAKGKYGQPLTRAAMTPPKKKGKKPDEDGESPKQ